MLELTKSGLSREKSYKMVQSYVKKCFEEIGYNNKWLTKDDLLLAVKKIGKNEYSDYLKAVLKKN